MTTRNPLLMNRTTIMFNELYPELAVSVGAYEKLMETEIFG